MVLEMGKTGQRLVFLQEVNLVAIGTVRVCLSSADPKDRTPHYA